MIPVRPPVDALLCRRPDLVVELRGGQDSVVSFSGRSVGGGPHSLKVLDAFAAPVTLKAALERLGRSVTGARAWMDLTTTAVQFVDAAVIVPVEEAHRQQAAGGRGFADPWIHIGMLDDQVRTDAFLSAIRAVVEPGDVVLEVGTGTGVLSVAAVDAGAAAVYAVEAGAAAPWARRVFAANEVDHRVSLLEGWSSNVELPQLATVFVGEIVDNDPLTERVLETVLDARARLLTPHARFIPSRVRVYAVPVTIPEQVQSHHRFTEHRTAIWAERYGIDFSALVDATRGEPTVCTAAPADVLDWTWLSEPVLMADLDLATVDTAVVDTEHDVTCVVDGRLDGLFVYFELDLGGGVSLDSHPRSTGYPHSWRIPVWMSGSPVAVHAGQRLAVRYAYGRAGVDSLRRASVRLKD